MSKILPLFLAAVAAFTGSQALAQSKITPEKEALIREILEVTGSTKSVKETSMVMLKFQQAESEKRLAVMIDKDAALSNEDKTRVKAEATEALSHMSDRIRDFFTTELDLAKVMTEVIVPIYDRNFTETELRDLIAFYRSATGQKSMTIMPKIMMETLTGFSEKVGPQLEEFIENATKQEFAQLKQKLEQDKKIVPKPKGKS